MRKTKGQSAVELALALPVVITILFGFVAIAQMYTVQEALSDMAFYVSRRAANAAGDGGTGEWPEYFQDDVRAMADVFIDPNDVSLSISPDKVPTPCYPQLITVTISAPWGLNIPFWGRVGSDLSATATALCEKP
jgi:Flp pilus assembly protein TadG